MSAAGPAPAPALSDAAAVHRAPRGRLRLAHQMSQVTTYTCDRCGKSATDPKLLPLFAVSVDVSVPIWLRTTWRMRPARAEWCEACTNAVGFVQRNEVEPMDSPKQPPTPTWDDLIREIVRDEMQNAGGQPQ